jgi:hypothetical protein
MERTIQPEISSPRGSADERLREHREAVTRAGVVLPGISPLSSPPGSVTRGSSGIRTALAPERFLGCASALPSVDLYAGDSETFLDLTG